MCMCIHICGCAWKPEKDVGSPEARVAGICESPNHGY